jgi:SAM-dependent methyltransferase
VDWRVKALLQLAFSRLPAGTRLNYLFQRWVTKSLPADERMFISHAKSARHHIDSVERHLDRPLGELTFYEFGVGWDLIVPLSLYSLGVNNQIVIDVRRLSTASLVRDTLGKFQQERPQLQWRRTPDPYPTNNGQVVPLLKARYGIEYRAPSDARKTDFPTGVVDCITSTNTLEHVPATDLVAIFNECHRILRDDGLLSFRIDYQDHYSYFDHGISAYNFLRYSERRWSLFSPSLHYQNRLRHRDYVGLARATGFVVIEEERVEGTAADLRTIERLPIDDRFQKYSLPELAVRSGFLTLRKEISQKGKVSGEPALAGSK